MKKLDKSKINEIKSKLNSFKTLKEKECFHEFLFCLLTPQSNAQRCWLAVEEIKKLKNPTYSEINSILKSKTRFHNNKTKYILNAYQIWPEISKIIKQSNTQEVRNTLADKVKGYGLKESSHFLRNIGKSNNQIAILDRHILKNLKNSNIIEDIKIKSKLHYLEIEKAYLNYAKQINIPADELDILWWSQENGEIFK